MDRVVLKWTLDYGTTEVPAGFVRQVAFQHRKLTAWVEHQLIDGRLQEDKKMTLEVVPTGGLFSADNLFVGTAVSDEYVWHAYQR